MKCCSCCVELTLSACESDDLSSTWSFAHIGGCGDRCGGDRVNGVGGGGGDIGPARGRGLGAGNEYEYPNPN